jgi:hypothetical protein
VFVHDFRMWRNLPLCKNAPGMLLRIIRAALTLKSKVLAAARCFANLAPFFQVKFC